MDDKIKVTDKRMFDSSGDLREEYRERDDPSEATASTSKPVVGAPPSAPVEPEAVETATRAQPDRQAHEGSARDTRQLPEPRFMDLIDLLAQPILMFLGDAQLPDGGSAQNLGLARYHIDLLELVATKTKGNLDPQEEKVLADLLYEFRLRYVEKAG